MAGCRRPAEPCVRSGWRALGVSPQSCWAGSSCRPSDAPCLCEVTAAKSSRPEEGRESSSSCWEDQSEPYALGWEITENLTANATIQAPVQKATEESQQPELWYLLGRVLGAQLFGCPVSPDKLCADRICVGHAAVCRKMPSLPLRSHFRGL